MHKLHIDHNVSHSLTSVCVLLQHEFEVIARQFENHPQIRLVLKYDETLSHAIYSAADVFVIPSIFEPCGLTQVDAFMPCLFSLKIH